MVRMQGRRILDRIYRFLKFIYIKLFRINDSPQRISLGFALGVFVGVMPVISLREAFFLALFFRMNWASALLGCLLTDNWTTVLTFLLAIKIGSYIMRVDWYSVYAASQQLLKHFHWLDLLKLSGLKIFAPAIIGYIVISLFFAFLSYLFALILVTKIKFKKRKNNMKKILLSFAVVIGIATFTSCVFAAPEEAIKENILSEANKAIDSNAAINALDEHGFTPLINAIKSNSFDTVNSLLEKGADVNIKDDNTGETALIWAAALGSLDTVKLLIDKGADVNAKTYTGGTALMCLANGERLERSNKENALEITKLLIDKGSDVNAIDGAKQTALMIAAMSNSLEISKFLIANGADINAQQDYKMTALMVAISHSSLDVAKLLIEKGADVNVANMTKETALMMAAEVDFVDIAKLLIEKGADINAKDKEGKTALTMANDLGHADIVNLLKQPKRDMGEAGGKQ